MRLCRPGVVDSWRSQCGSKISATTILFVRWSKNQKMPGFQFSCAKPAAGCQYSVDNINMEPFFGPSHPLCPALVVKNHDIQVSLCKTSCILLTISIWSQKRWEDKLGGGTGCKYNSSFINEPPSSAPLCTLLLKPATAIELDCLIKITRLHMVRVSGIITISMVFDLVISAASSRSHCCKLLLLSSAFSQPSSSLSPSSKPCHSQE